MDSRAKTFDCIAFKDEMQRWVAEASPAASPEERRRQRREALAKGDLGAWWQRISTDAEAK